MPVVNVPAVVSVIVISLISAPFSDILTVSLILAVAEPDTQTAYVNVALDTTEFLPSTDTVISPLSLIFVNKGMR